MHIVLNKLDTAWYQVGGPYETYNARLVKYANDFVIMAARYIGQPIKDEVQSIISSMGLSFNKEKTSIVNLGSEDALIFLGYNIRMSQNYGNNHTA